MKYSKCKNCGRKIQWGDRSLHWYYFGDYPYSGYVCDYIEPTDYSRGERHVATYKEDNIRKILNKVQ